VAIVAPLVVFIYPPQGQEKRKNVAIKLDKPVDQLGADEAVKFQSPKETGFVMKDGGGDNGPGKIAFAGYLVKEAAGGLAAFAVNCSHLGCSVEFNGGAKRFDCPCHGSQFSLNGDVLHGPAVFSLSHLGFTQGSGPDEIQVEGVELKGIG
jgi:Rieske Fe-S protein